ncbi:Uncharacterized protein dnm_044440 [Desulfonema magnum]|uniref:Uncharacterized protein n=1 Tax=Desulfonema magnum TaxID=45655 RepID=A0A975BMG4_9BACT|nr:Uncharacterized protein dnm_044440 [Desulfonema magnum]
MTNQFHIYICVKKMNDYHQMNQKIGHGFFINRYELVVTTKNEKFVIFPNT